MKLVLDYTNGAYQEEVR